MILFRHLGLAAQQDALLLTRPVQSVIQLKLSFNKLKEKVVSIIDIDIDIAIFTVDKKLYATSPMWRNLLYCSEHGK